MKNVLRNSDRDESLPLPKANPQWGREEETEIFRHKVKQFRRGKISEDDFRRFRLQNGAYGSRLQQNYSMVRIKVPTGEILPDQLEKIATLAEAFSIGSAHVSTRQNIQLHWVQLEDVSEVMRGLVDVGLTTREACGNTVRNVMCSHLAGVCSNEVFDSTPYARAIARFLLRNPICQNLPRKFKINFGCCNEHGLVRIADIGLVPMTSGETRGFKFYLGGGLGAASFIGYELEDFTPEERVLATCMAVIRLFDRLGNRENLARNRMRYLVHEMGWEKFRQLVLKERTNVEMTISFSTAKAFDPTSEYTSVTTVSHKNKYLPVINNPQDFDMSAYQRWAHTNVISQRQDGFNVVTVTLGAGDITSNQLRGLARIIRNLSDEGSARNTPNQNFAVRFVHTENLPAFYKGLLEIGLANPGALTIASAVGCSGTTSCNLAITNSHRLAKEVQLKLLQLNMDMDDSLKDSTIKISGCPNSCGQHEIATIGFYGGASRIGGSMAPTYTMLLGGRGGEKGELAKSMMRIPAKKVIPTILRIIEIYREERKENESLNSWVRRIVDANGDGKIRNLNDLKLALVELTNLASITEDPEAYRDYGNESKFSAKTAKGECAA